MLLVFCLWWMYFLLPSGNALHHHRERGFVWGYGHVVLFAAVAALGACLEVVADVLKTAHPGAGHAAAGHGAEAAGAAAAHGVSATYAIASVAVAEAVFVLSLWVLYRYLVRAQQQDWFLPLICLACIALAPVAVSLGVPLQWGLLLLSVGPIIAIAHHEYGNRARPDAFAVR
jgi:hypothetical protein